MIKIILSAFTGFLLLNTPTFASTTKVSTMAPIELSDDSTSLLREQLIAAIKHCNNGLEFKKARKEIHGAELLFCIRIECELFRFYGDLVRKGEYSNILENKRLALNLKYKLTEIQISELPEMRVAYKKAILGIVRANIHIRVSKNTKTFNFTSEMISSEEDILKLNTAFLEDLCLLRFDKAVYKQKRQDIESDCFTIDSPADSVLF